MAINDYRNIRGNAAAKKFFRGSPISLTKHAQMLIQSIPGSSVEITNNVLLWSGEVQPTAMSSKYKIKIEYRIASIPKVFVVDPPLQRRKKDEPIPHLYQQERLCLYFPPANEWNNTKSLHKTVLPWAVLWLMYYEYWHVTGDWDGGGIHVDIDTSEPNHE